MTDWEVLLIPEVYGLPLAGYGMPVACTTAVEGGVMLGGGMAKETQIYQCITTESEVPFEPCSWKEFFFCPTKLYRVFPHVANSSG